MKKLLFLLLALPIWVNAQNAQNIVPSRNYVYPKKPLFIPMLLDSGVQIYKTSIDSVTWKNVKYTDTASMLSSYLRKELDPTVPSYSKGLTSFSVIKSSTDPLYRPISYVPSWSDITGKPTFANVATTGAYADLTGKPTIPSAQVQTDWNASSGMGVLLNKPTLSTVATTGSYNDLSNKPTIPASQVQSDWNANSGMGQILNKPTITRVEAYSGTTNASGEYTVTFATPFASTPKVVAVPVTTDNRANVIVTSRSTTGFTVRMVTYQVVSLLSVELIAGAPVAVNNGTVQVVVVQ